MPRRLTGEEVQARQDEIDELTAQIKELQAKRSKLVLRQYWLRANRKRYPKHPTEHASGLSFELYGKRRKDLTPDELREYNRVSQKRWRDSCIAMCKGEN
jgi:hypothetical protein